MSELTLLVGIVKLAGLGLATVLSPATTSCPATAGLICVDLNSEPWTTVSAGILIGNISG